MAIFSRFMFGLVDMAARKGLAGAGGDARRDKARETGIRGETYAYWYLRRHGYVFVARNYTAPGIKGEIDLVGYDGRVLAFVEVKTRSAAEDSRAEPEEAVTADKRRILSRMARRFLAERCIAEADCRFDVLAIECRAGRRPEVRLHKGAFGAGG